MKKKLKLEPHQKQAAHHLYVGFAAGVIVTAGIILAWHVFFGEEQASETEQIQEEFIHLQEAL